MNEYNSSPWMIIYQSFPSGGNYSNGLDAVATTNLQTETI